ncbi:MAG: SPASM domain-containing protein [candidate division Zixibacteria bacterium]|nr:SPASM domain-containing protein [candidate division Zixibacteria bacterium]
MPNEKYKSSKYNHFVPTNEGQVLAFNALSCGLGQMDKESYGIYQRIVNGEITDYTQIPQDLFEKLKDGNFIIPDTTDEIQKLKVANWSARFTNQGFGLTIIPTLQCNFACDYCFEPGTSDNRNDPKRRLMTPEVQNGLVEVVKSMLPQGTLLGITWYGGEPLLGLEVMESLTKRFKEICEEKKAKYSAGIITNGYLLMPEVVNKLTHLGISFAQVTIDGPEEIHNQRRPLVNKGPTYQTIMENLKSIPEDIPFSLAIRVNVDDRNRKHTFQLLEELKKHNLHNRKNISVYFSRVVAYTSSCKDIGEHCIVAREFALEELELYKEAIGLGFKLRYYPVVLVGNCGAVKTNSFVVEPDGALHLCWNTVGRDKMKVGNIENSSVKLNDTYYKWLSCSPFDKKGCENCSILPLCMSGCPYTSIYPSETLSKDKSNCVTWKYNLKEMIQFYVEAKKLGLFVPPKRIAEKTEQGKPKDNNERENYISKLPPYNKQAAEIKKLAQHKQ